MAEQKRFKCIGDCKKEFSFGEWFCFDGVKHEVEPKDYYINDAPYHDGKLDPNGLALRASRNHKYLLPPLRVSDETGTRMVERPPTLWVMGRLSTNDPELQYFIERAKIDVGYDRWFEAYHTETQKQRIKGNNIAQREDKLKEAQATENELLERIKRLNREAAELEKANEEKKLAKAGK